MDSIFNVFLFLVLILFFLLLFRRDKTTLIGLLHCTFFQPTLLLCPIDCLPYQGVSLSATQMLIPVNPHQHLERLGFSHRIRRDAVIYIELKTHKTGLTRPPFPFRCDTRDAHLLSPNLYTIEMKHGNFDWTIR